MLFLCLRQMLGKHTGYLGDAFFLCGKDAPMTGDDVVILIHDDRIHESELPQGSPQLKHLLLAVGAGISGVWHQLINIHFSNRSVVFIAHLR